MNSRILDHPVAVTMLLLTISILGIVSLLRLPVSLMPDMDIPCITVQFDDARMSAEELNTGVLAPLKVRLQQIDGLEDLFMEASDGHGIIKLFFDERADIDYLFIEVNEKIDRALPELAEVPRPKIMKIGASDIPAFFINITPCEESNKEESFSELSNFVKNVISRRIEQLDEVAMVDMSGCVSEEIHIIPDMDALSRSGLSLHDIEDLVSSANVRLGSLTIRDGEYQYQVRFRSFALGIEDIESIWFKVGGKLHQLKEIATVKLVPSITDGHVRFDGRRSISLAVIKQSSSRMKDLRRGVLGIVNQLQKEYPELSFAITRDQTGLLKYSIRTLVLNIILGFIFSCFVVLLFMRDNKSSLLVSLFIPVSLLLSMLIFNMVGLSINVISLSGLILGLGMLVDNGIVLVDNITSVWKSGTSLREAVIKGTSEVMGAMLSSILTTCAVFIPLLFVNGTAAILFHDQALSITIILLSSWLVSVLAIPVFYYNWNKTAPRQEYNNKRKQNRFERLVECGDRSLMKFFISSPRRCWSVLFFSVIGFLLLFGKLNIEKLPPMTSSETILHIKWNESLPLIQNESRVSELEDKIENSLQISSLVGPQQFLLTHSGKIVDDEASIYMKFKDEKDLVSNQRKIKSWMSDNYPSALFDFSPSDNIFNQVFSDREAPLVVHLYPNKPEYYTTDNIKSAIDIIASLTPDIHIESVPQKTNLVLMADPELMTLYDVPISSLIETLKSALGQNKIYSLTQGENNIPVIISNGKNSIDSSLRGLTVTSSSGNSIPVSLLMKSQWENDLKILRTGMDGENYPINIDLPGKQIKHIMKDIKEQLIVDGRFDVSFSGSWFSNREMIKEMLFAFAVAIIILFLILASQFESIVQPLIILSEIVIDVFCCLVFLWIFNMSINIMSMIGIIVVSGIVINDSILKIDTINKVRKAGFSLTSSLMIASDRRRRAILMTSLTTILSVCPFLIRGSMGADLQFPMSIIIIIGMVFGTFVSLYIVPAMYFSIYDKKN